MAIQPRKASWLKAQRWFARDALGFTVGMRSEYGDLVHLPAPFGFGQYLVYHPDHVYAILVKYADKLEKPEIIKKIIRSSFGNGLLFSEGALWKRQRRLMQPAFHHGRLGRYADRIVAFAQAMIANWKEGETRGLDSDMRALTLQIVVDALFKTDISSNTEQIGEGMQMLGESLNDQSKSPALAMLPENFPHKVLRRKRDAVAHINPIIYRLIKERRANGEDKGDLLSVLLFAKDEETGESMSEGQLRDELMTLFIAGHETTATTLSWAFIELAKHPESEAAFHAELNSVLQGRAPTLTDLANMSYTQAVIKEVLRLYPPAVLIIRKALEDIDLGDGNVIPKGMIIQINQYANHHDARFFPEPEAFKPERWLDPNFEKNLPKGAYFPFGAGPRICIGNGFALMEAPLVLATIGSRFRLEPITAPEPYIGVALGFKQPVNVRVCPTELTI
jgi:cytochrome P450